MFDNNNYFLLFELPIALPVDIVLLNQKYQQLQRQYHPDNYATATDSERVTAIQKSATINLAYRTLKDPVSAAEYRVSLEGIDINSEQHTLFDPVFLEEQFELREKLDDIEQSENWSTLDIFYDEMIARKKQVCEQLLSVIAKSEWQAAEMIIYRLRYFTRLIEQIELLQEKQFEL